MPIAWEELIHIDRKWVEKQLNHHFIYPNNKVVVRGYTTKALGTSIKPDAIADVLSDMISEYVHGEKRANALGATRAFKSASRYFGQKDTDTDGKYGELLLFALVEAVLGCKMVAHKLRSLSNFRDQVKGGDGIFIGNYQVNNKEKNIAYLIGESKIMKNYSAAVKDACQSIDRFHDPKNSTEFFSTELIVTKDNLIIDDISDLDELYDRLTPSSDLFKTQVLVHPILIMYDTAKINTLETKAKTNIELEALIKAEVIKNKKHYSDTISGAISLLPNIKKVYLDFFIIPFNNVRSFRNAMYYNIHGVSYPDKDE